MRASRSRRRLLVLSAGAVLGGLLIPALLWLALPRPTPPVQAGSPQVVRVSRAPDDPIPSDWSPPDLNPALEDQVLLLPETLPLSETAALSTALPLATAPLTVSYPALVASEALNVRDGPGGSYLPLQVLQQTTQLTIVAVYDGWYNIITPQGVLGWADARFVSTNVLSTTLPVPAQVPSATPALIGYLDETIDGANLRSGPSRGTDPLQVLHPNDGALTLLLRFNDWFQIQAPNGNVGWVSSDLVEASDFVVRRVPILTARPEALEAVRMARGYVGYAYVWGSSSPRVGFDCSGLVKYVFGRLGIEFPHSSAAQWQSDVGIKIHDRDLLRPGDIVFFKNTYKRGVSHVGIYAGNRLIIQAISESVGVSVSSLDEPYWSSRFVGAIRAFP